MLTSSQLSTLARLKYLNDIKTTLPRAQVPFTQEDIEEEEPIRQIQAPKSGWFNYFSLESMGLAEYADNPSTSPLQYVTRLIPGLAPSAPRAAEIELFDQDEEEDKAEAERLFLTYTWWILHGGWREVADRVDDAVERVFAKYVSVWDRSRKDLMI
jgi:peroxin-3